eukprot:1674817-Prymnesium_polylepis.1
MQKKALGAPTCEAFLSCGLLRSEGVTGSGRAEWCLAGLGSHEHRRVHDAPCLPRVPSLKARVKLLYTCGVRCGGQVTASPQTSHTTRVDEAANKVSCVCTEVVN